MKSFDYESAWHDLAKPGYETLPANVRDLLAYTAEAAKDLAQLPDCSMPWPELDSEYGDLQTRFEKIPGEWLAAAARVIYSVGHWYPGKSAEGYPIPGREAGAHWKFAHYADQSLRARLGVRTTDDPGVTLRIHEGVIRLCYSSRDTWQWEEIQPATEGGYTRAQAIADQLRMALSHAAPEATKRRADWEARDHAAWTFMEALKAAPVNPDDWPGQYFGRIVDLGPYMVDEAVLDARRCAAADAATDWAEELRKYHAKVDSQIAKLNRERARIAWFVERKYPIGNVIYYDHTDTVCIGWYKPLDAEAYRIWVDRLGAGYPWQYSYKHAPGFDPARVGA